MGQGINYDYIISYIRNTLAPSQGLLLEMEEYAAANHVPILQPEAAKMIYLLCKLRAPKSILEIGTAIGYSAILLSGTLQTGGKLTTIERDDKMVELANQNISRAGLKDVIEILQGDALEVLDKINLKFDVIFIDAAKGHYMEFFERAIKLLNTDGLIVSDNILFRGMVANDELIEKRDKTIAKRMREYLDYICNSKEYESSIIPIGDGVSLTIRRD